MVFEIFAKKEATVSFLNVVSATNHWIDFNKISVILQILV